MNSRPAPGGCRKVSRFRPRLESLEDRIQLGDTILGLWTVAPSGLSSFPADDLRALEAGSYCEQPQGGFRPNWPTADSLTAMAWRANSPREETYHPTSDGEAVGDPGAELAAYCDIPSSVSENALTEPLAVSDLAGPAWESSQQTGLGVMGSAVAASGQSSSAALAPAALATVGISAPPSVGLLAVAGMGSSGSPPVRLSFDGTRGQLGIRTDAGQHTISESLTSDGFLNLTIDGQSHSGNPRSAAFDTALSGATGARVAGISFQGGGQDTLILASRQHAGGFTVQASGATVVAQNVSTSGLLAIQAPNITVSGAVQASGVSLAASGWINVNAAGRIDASSERAGDVSPLSGITLAAAIFLNSGQIHADGPSGGQVRIQAANILNAGPITADATAPNGGGGQVQIVFTGGYEATISAVISANGDTGPGGQVSLDGGSTGHLFTSGRHLVTGSVGGTAALAARDIVVAGATIDASGTAGGGTVHIATPLQDSKASGSNTGTVTVTPASAIRADALQSGSGGRVDVWASQSAIFAGSMSARGGPAGGSGGVIELSGRGDVSYAGSVDAAAPLGKSGTLLLDPKNITISADPDVAFPQYNLLDPHPTLGGSFGSTVSALNNGNVVVSNPNDDFVGVNAGAVYLFNGLTGALISTLVGSNAGDEVGSGFFTGLRFVNGVVSLTNGNFLALSPIWNSNRGAVTWGNGETGVSGIVSDANSLIGSQPGDRVGGGTQGVLPISDIAVLSNGNYVIPSPSWNGFRGAVTWGNGLTGTSGIVSDANSLVGSNPYDEVGGAIILLSNGNYVVDSVGWNNGRGAVTWGSGATGISGVVSDANSLVGSNPSDDVGATSSGYSVIPLNNGNYVVDSELWNGWRGAVTWGNGSIGTTGLVSEDNSLVGSNPNDYVGVRVFALTNGNYVVQSPEWNSQQPTRRPDVGQRQHRDQRNDLRRQ